MDCYQDDALSFIIPVPLEPRRSPHTQDPNLGVKDRSSSRVSTISDSTTNSFSSAALDLPSLSNPLNLYQDSNPMTTGIYGSLESQESRDQRQVEEAFQIGTRGLDAVQKLGQRKLSSESFEFPDLSSVSAPNTQPTSPIDDQFGRASFRTIREDAGVNNPVQNATAGSSGAATSSSNHKASLQRQDTIDFPTPSSLSRSTTSESFDAFSLLDEIEFTAPAEDVPPPPPCPSGLYGSLLSAQHHGGSSNLVNTAFGGMLRTGGRGGDRPLGSGVGLRNFSPMPAQRSASTANGVKSDSVSMASTVSGAEGWPCLLEVNRVTLSDMDLFSGVWVSEEEAEEELKGVPDEMQFSGR